VSVSIAYQDKYVIDLVGNGASSGAVPTAKDLISAFALDGSGSTFKVDYSDSTGDKFKAIMKYVIDNATADDNLGGADKTLKDRLGADMLRTFHEIFADALPNMLQSEYTLVHEVKSAEGAADMTNKLQAGPREIIAQQLPESNYEAFMDLSENPINSHLPLVSGDTLVFVFDVNQHLVTRKEKKTAGTTGDNLSNVTQSGAPSGLGAAGTGAYGSPSQEVKYAYNSRKVAFFVKVLELVNPRAALV
jgi:hypothetical protein